MKLSFLYPLIGQLSLFFPVHPVRGSVRILGGKRQQRRHESDSHSHNEGDGDGGVTQLDLRGVALEPKPWNTATRSARSWPFRTSGHDVPMRRTPQLLRADHADKTVVVIGAGYAGWGAARRLVEGGMRAEDITILEADADYGGRTKSDETFAPFPLDSGASYVHHSFRDELAAIAGVPVADLPLVDMESGWYLWRNGTTYHGFLADHIVSKLDGVNTQYGCQVTAVDYQPADGVNTTCEDGRSYVSTHAIVTVPLSVLKEGDIEFRPALPAAIQENVYSRGWNRGFTIFLEFEAGFVPYDHSCFPDDDCDHYDEDGVLLGEHMFWDCTRFSAPNFDGDGNIVAGYIVGSFADEFEGMNEGQVVARILEKFNDYYHWQGTYHRGYTPDVYKGHLLVDWSDPETKPFVRGTYSRPWDGFAGHRADPGHRLFLAGEAFPAPLADGRGGYEEEGGVYTALHSGEKAAELVLDPQADLRRAGAAEVGAGGAGGVPRQG